jgi:hypothetical protein
VGRRNRVDGPVGQALAQVVRRAFGERGKRNERSDRAARGQHARVAARSHELSGIVEFSLAEPAFDDHDAGPGQWFADGQPGA